MSFPGQPSPPQPPGVLESLQGVVAIGRFLHLATIRVRPDGMDMDGRNGRTPGRGLRG
jgi:hypothetical protein